MARRKMSWPNRLINAGLFALAFARPIQILLGSESFTNKAKRIQEEAIGQTGGGAPPGNLQVLANFYGPVAAAFVLFEVKKMAMKKFRF